MYFVRVGLRVLVLVLVLVLVHGMACAQDSDSDSPMSDGLFVFAMHTKRIERASLDGVGPRIRIETLVSRGSSSPSPARWPSFT